MNEALQQSLYDITQQARSDMLRACIVYSIS